MKRFKKTVSVLSMALMILSNTMVSYAVAPEIKIEEPEAQASDETQYTSIIADTSNETIDISNIVKSRAQAFLGDNPRTWVSNTLTASNQQDFLLFSVTVSQTANNGFSLNGLPAGDYAVWIHSTDDSYDSSYNFYINSTNPSGTVSKLRRQTADLQYVAMQYSDGSYYSNGNYIFNDSMIGTTVQGQFDWERKYDFQTGSNYAYRQMKVSNVVPLGVAGPTYYRSNYASSDDVLLIACDVGTT